jgi:hypothetical protein
MHRRMIERRIYKGVMPMPAHRKILRTLALCVEKRSSTNGLEVSHLGVSLVERLQPAGL